MTATAITIADALVTELNGHAFSQSFKAVRAYLPCYKLEDMGTLHVTVVPATFESEPADRSRDLERHVLHVAVQQRFSGDVSNGSLDALVLLCQEIRDFLRTLVLTNASQSRRTKTECKPIYDPGHLKEFGQFTSLLAITYSVAR
jgi:hypothetical protein